MENIQYLISIYTLLSVYFAAALFMFLKYIYSKKSEINSTRNRLYLLYGFFLILFMVGRIFLFIFDYYLTGFEYSNISALDFLIWKIGISFQMFGYATILSLMEYRILKQKDYYILVILYFLFYIIAMISSNLEDAGIYTVVAAFFSFFIPIGYLYIGIKSEQKIRRKAFLIFLGFMIFFSAMIFDLEPVILPLMNALNITRIQVFIFVNILKTGAIILFFLGFK